MQRVKATGEYQVTADLFKEGKQIVLEKLATLHAQSDNLDSTGISKNANIILIHKKGYVEDLKNYRPISLLSIAYKAFTNVFGNRIRTMLDFNQPKDKAGFLKDYSTRDHIYIINMVVGKCAEYNLPLHIAFIDYEKAFDSVETSSVMRAFRKQGVDEPYVKILECTFSGSTATIFLHKERNKISRNKGVRQGETISQM